ncbi:MAG: helix-hairpin-helix domain-containing protein [Candidatus Heimdallarchaeota archaeon]
MALGERWACYADEIRVLAKRMNKGLPENAVELQERLGISRGKAIALVKGGIRSFEELARTDLTKLTKIPGIGRKTVQVIQQAFST